jgi:nucleotide-binding universal stress UspA family protein
MGLRKILCPIDFSPSSREALTVALRLATQHRSELLVSFVWTTAPTGAAGKLLAPDEIVQDLVAQARWGLGTLAETATSSVSPCLVDDQPWSKIVELADADPEIDLIVINNHGRTGLAQRLLGSVAELVVRHAPCPVLVVPDDTLAQPFNRALCAVDLSPQSEIAVWLAIDLMQSPVQLTLLHVLESSSFYNEELAPVEVDTRLDTSIEDELDRWRSTLPIPTVSELRVGRADLEILMTAENPVFDLVVVATHGRVGLRRMILGSVAETVVRQAHRPVLVARTRRGPRRFRSTKKSATAATV